jgi:hypothetical protein
LFNNIPNREKGAVVEKPGQGFEDPKKMEDIYVYLRQKRYSKSSDTIDRFSQDIWNHRAFPRALEEDKGNERARTYKQRTQEKKLGHRCFSQ